MTIVERSKVLASYSRAKELGASHEEAVATVARALGLQLEVVEAAVQQEEPTCAN